MMKIIFLLLILSFSSLTFASGSIFTNTILSDDTDGSTILKQEIGLWYSKNSRVDNGVSFQYSSFDQDKSTRISSLYSRRFDGNYGIDSDIGIETLFNEITGKIKLSSWHKNGTIEANIQRDFVDNARGTQNGITYTMGYLLGEYHINDLILVGVLGQTRFSDNPKRNEARLIASHPIAENTHIRLETQYYEFDSFSAFYFSPNEYYRYLAGLQHYQTISANWYILMKALYGQQSVNGFTKNSYLVGLTTGYNFDRMPLEVKFEVTLDQKEPNYTYKIASLNLVYRF